MFKIIWFQKHRLFFLVDIFRHNNFYFLVPLIAPIFGALIAAESYNIFIGRHMPGNCGEPVSCN